MKDFSNRDSVEPLVALSDSCVLNSQFLKRASALAPFHRLLLVRWHLTRHLNVLNTNLTWPELLELLGASVEASHASAIPEVMTNLCPDAKSRHLYSDAWNFVCRIRFAEEVSLFCISGSKWWCWTIHSQDEGQVWLRRSHTDSEPPGWLLSECASRASQEDARSPVDSNGLSPVALVLGSKRVGDSLVQIDMYSAVRGALWPEPLESVRVSGPVMGGAPLAFEHEVAVPALVEDWPEPVFGRWTDQRRSLIEAASESSDGPVDVHGLREENPRPLTILVSLELEKRVLINQADVLGAIIRFLTQRWTGPLVLVSMGLAGTPENNYEESVFEQVASKEEALLTEVLRDHRETVTWTTLHGVAVNQRTETWDAADLVLGPLGSATAPCLSWRDIPAIIWKPKVHYWMPTARFTSARTIVLGTVEGPRGMLSVRSDMDFAGSSYWVELGDVKAAMEAVWPTVIGRPWSDESRLGLEYLRAKHLDRTASA